MVSHAADEIQSAERLGQSPEAVARWRKILWEKRNVDEADYSTWARTLAAIYERGGRGLAAARIHEYLLSVEPAIALYEKYGGPRDVGRVLRLGNRLDAASRKYREASLFAHAGQAAEESGDLEFALTAYEQVSRQMEATGERYLAGLGALNAGRIANQIDPKSGRTVALLAQATRSLEQEADERESRGDREGAFRCYLCLIVIGQTETSYENLAEGYLNCIRILKAKNDRFFTMQYYYDFISQAEALGELHSVAELYREAGEYARRVGFIYGDYFLQNAAEAWKRVGAEGLAGGNPPELVENALLAAVSCFNRIEDDTGVADAYSLICELPLSESKNKRYVALAKELREEAERKGPRERPTPVPEYFRRPLRMPKIWERDLLAAESGKDIPDAIGRLVGDYKNVFQVDRRKALIIALMYDDHIQSGGAPLLVPAPLVERLGSLNRAAAVPPFLALYEAGDAATRVMLLQRTQSIKHREIFTLIDQALHEDNAEVVEAGVRALRRMTFPQALDSLVRIYNGNADETVKDACLRSIAAIGTDSACEFLLDTLRSSSGALAHQAKSLLEENAQERMLSALERNRRSEPDPSLRIFIGRLIDKIRTRRGSVSF